MLKHFKLKWPVDSRQAANNLENLLFTTLFVHLIVSVYILNVDLIQKSITHAFLFKQKH